MMIFTPLLFLSSMSALVMAAPTLHSKRIAQVIADSTQKWEQACLTAGGGQKCNPVSVAAFSTLLAAAGPCDQQNQADAMIDLAKSLNNDADMIKFAQIFAQQPRNTPTSQSVPYCQQAPKNAELTGLFQCQFAGADPNTFVGGIAVGGAGTVPFGQSSPLSPPGSCPANPSGPIPDGSQLVDITQSPGTGSKNGSSTQSGNNSSNGGAAGSNATTAPAMTSTDSAPIATPTTVGADGGSSFALQNGKDAQALNAKFAQLTADSPCDDGENACVGTSFAQCVGGKFALTSCGTDVVCAALPLVNSRGTSITCARPADVVSRIQATGATGGITGA